MTTKPNSIVIPIQYTDNKGEPMEIADGTEFRRMTRETLRSVTRNLPYLMIEEYGSPETQWNNTIARGALFYMYQDDGSEIPVDMIELITTISRAVARYHGQAEAVEVTGTATLTPLGE